MENQDTNKLAFKFSTKGLPEGWGLKKLNNRLDTIVRLENTLGFKKLVFHSHKTNELSIDIKEFVSSWNQRDTVTIYWYDILVEKLDTTIKNLRQLVKKQELKQEEYIESKCPEGEMKEYTFFYTIRTYDGDLGVALFKSGMKSCKGVDAVEAGNKLLDRLKKSKPFYEVTAFNLIK